jgi:hypothetical protein
MKRILFLLVCGLALSLFSNAEDKKMGTKIKENQEKLIIHNLKQKISQIDLDLALEQYKQARMELFRTEMQARLVSTESKKRPSEEIKLERDRLGMRIAILQSMADELTAKIEKLGRESVESPYR